MGPHLTLRHNFLDSDHLREMSATTDPAFLMRFRQFLMNTGLDEETYFPLRLVPEVIPYNQPKP